jgi:hypothetical protein
MNPRIAIGLLLASASVLSSESQDTPSVVPATDMPRVLSASSRVRFEMPILGSSGRVHCDSAGDMVFNVARGVFDQGPFLRVRSDGRAHVIYSLPQQVAGRGNIVWAMSPGGTFYVLHEDFKEYKLVRFREDYSLMAVDGLSAAKDIVPVR